MSLRSASTCLPGCKSGVRLGGNPDNFCLLNLITEAKGSKWHALPKAPTCRTLQSGSSETSGSSYIIHWANAATWANRLFFRWSLRKNMSEVPRQNKDLEGWQVFSQPLLISCGPNELVVPVPVGSVQICHKLRRLTRFFIQLVPSGSNGGTLIILICSSYRFWILDAM